MVSQAYRSVQPRASPNHQFEEMPNAGTITWHLNVEFKNIGARQHQAHGRATVTGLTTGATRAVRVRQSFPKE
jgi:hypothetical protein